MLATFAIVSILLAIAYAALLSLYLHGWRSLPVWNIPKDWEPATKVSVVIPARNEAANIGACLRSIIEGTYPVNLLEIIVIDDYSDDGTAALAARFAEDLSPGICVLSLADFIPPGESVHAHKKRAIEAGIARASGELIVTTDADCVVPKDWLRLVVSAFSPPQSPHEGGSIAPASGLKNWKGAPPPLMGGLGGAIAPVAFHRERNLLQRFQSLDFLGLMGITGAGIQLGWQRMGNGANLAYPKALFEAVGGFAGNEHHASGDDMFLIQKVAARWPGSVCFIKTPDATVLTEAKPDWHSFLQQRLRWGTKNAALPEWPVRLSLLIVFLFCWSILLNAFLVAFAVAGMPVVGTLAVVGVSANITLPAILLLQLATKSVFDYLFLREMCRFFKREDLMQWFVPSFFLHTFYISIVGTASLFVKKYKWKERQVH